jgi:hypothetical protein
LLGVEKEETRGQQLQDTMRDAVIASQRIANRDAKSHTNSAPVGAANRRRYFAAR